MIKIFPPAGVALLWACAVGRVGGFCVRVALCPAPPWTRPVRGGGGWCGVVAVPVVPACGGGCVGFVGPRPRSVRRPPRVGMPPRQVWRGVSRTRRPSVSGGRGPPRGAGIWRACSARAALAGGNGIQTVLSVGARSYSGRFAQGKLFPRLMAGSVRLQLRYRKGNRLPQIGQYRQYSLTGYPQKGQRGPSGACTMTSSIQSVLLDFTIDISIRLW